MLRKALIGTSTPIGYDYQTKATKANSDLNSSPNPILDSPFGLLLFYDEIWFLCRSLCPENMRCLPYVHFVDEEIGVPASIGELGWRELDILAKSEEWKDIINNRRARVTSQKNPFSDGFKNYGVTWKAAIDNHTHGLQIGGITAYGNPTEDRLLFDLVLTKALKLYDLELITNTYTHPMLSKEENVSSHELSEFLIVQDIPNYLSRMGPYHPVVEEARENEYLKYFRKWVSSTGKTTSIAELREVKEAVEASIREVQDKLFLQYLDPNSFYKSLGKSVVGDAIGLLAPGSSTVTSVFEHLGGRKEKNEIRWQGFLVSMRGKV
ncbi:hypothetical protein F971_01431 [Acinetobacter vivianii]|uniref:Uncharacterized protein n=1 Tax=Acinetobacter vivianii TaxID=1776742 RepID=N8W909_9GAMM|nr:hypothetical protein [Acinetobacter vivianii]ENU93383.1 hypothetical protein F971_01431 [Acinetobacter vivianii]